MADVLTDVVFSISGTITYSDGEIGVLEAYYDSKAGGYSPSSTESLITDAQMQYSTTMPSTTVSGAAANWFTQFTWTSQVALGGSDYIDRSLGNPTTPTNVKDITDMVLHFRGLKTYADGDVLPISTTYDKWQGGSVGFAASSLSDSGDFLADLNEGVALAIFGGIITV